MKFLVSVEDNASDEIEVGTTVKVVKRTPRAYLAQSEKEDNARGEYRTSEQSIDWLNWIEFDSQFDSSNWLFSVLMGFFCRKFFHFPGLRFSFCKKSQIVLNLKKWLKDPSEVKSGESSEKKPPAKKTKRSAPVKQPAAVKKKPVKKGDFTLFWDQSGTFFYE